MPLKKGDKRNPSQIPEAERDYYLERRYPSFGNLVPRDVASRNAKVVCDEGRGVGETGLAVYLDFRDAIQRLGEDVIKERYGNLFDMYERITGEDPYKVPDAHLSGDPLHDGRPVGGLQPDVHDSRAVRDRRGQLLRPRRQPPGRQRADAGPGRRLLRPAEHHRRLPGARPSSRRSTATHPAVREAESQVDCVTKRLLEIKGTRSVDSYHRELGKIMWDYCGMSRNGRGPEDRRSREIPALREQFWRDVKVLGDGRGAEPVARKGGRVADFFELAELMCLDALERNESCGGHFREEYQTPEGEAARDDEHYSYAAAWEFRGVGKPPELHKEPLTFEYVHPSQRSYK